MKKIIVLSLIILVLSACSGLASDPEADRVEDVKVTIYALED